MTPSPLGLFYRWNAEHAFLEAAWADTPNRFLWSNVPGIDLILNDPEETRLVIAARDDAVTSAMTVMPPPPLTTP